MFTASTPTRRHRRIEGVAGCPGVARERPGIPAGLRLTGLMLILAAASWQRVSAQSIGTMQVTARVIPAPAAWAALEESRSVIRWALAGPHGAAVRRTGLLRTRAEVHGSDDRRQLVVTVHHPRN